MHRSAWSSGGGGERFPVPLLCRGFLSAAAAEGTHGAPPNLHEEETVQCVHHRDGHVQMARLQEAEAVPLRALPAGVLCTWLFPRTLSGAPASQGGGGQLDRGLHASSQQSLTCQCECHQQPAFLPWRVRQRGVMKSLWNSCWVTSSLIEHSEYIAFVPQARALLSKPYQQLKRMCYWAFI